MMLRIAETPEWDKVNEGKTLTSYHVAELFGCDLDEFIGILNGKTVRRNVYNEHFCVSGVYILEVLDNKNMTAE